MRRRGTLSWMKGVGDERDLYPCKTRNEQRSCKNICWADFGDISDGSIIVKVRSFQHYRNLVARSAIQHIARSPYVLPVYPESHPRYPIMRSSRQLHRRTTNIQLSSTRVVPTFHLFNGRQSSKPSNCRLRRSRRRRRHWDTLRRAGCLHHRGMFRQRRDARPWT